MFRTAVELRSYRAASEDRAEVFPCRHGVVIVVADGVGGRKGGGRASEVAVKLIGDAAQSLAASDSQAWRDLFFEIDRVLHADPAAGETTLVVAAVTPAGITGASVGDSEAWVVTESGRSPVISTSRRKPYLGDGMAIPVGLRHAPLSPTDTLLLATDGLFKYADLDRISAAARDADLAATAVAVAELPRNSAGSFYDDVAVVLCRGS